MPTWSPWSFAIAEVIGNWSMDFALDYPVYTSYVGEQQFPNFNNMFSVGCEVSPFTSTHSVPIGDCGVGFNPYDA